MIQGILFDMDGILFDTESLGLAIHDEVAGGMGFTLPDDYAVHVCGASHANVQRYMAEIFGDRFQPEAFDEQVHRLFDERLAAGVPPMPHLRETLDALQGMGLKMAVASSSRYNTVLHHLDDACIREYFSAIIGGDMVTHTKPDPTIFIKAAGALGLAPEACAVVEDSVNGVRAGHAAGCATIMIPDLMPATDELRALCAAVLPSLAELPACIEALNA